MKFLYGFFLGLAYAMPIGSQNIFVINSALAQKLPRSYITAAFVSFVDIILGLICLLGVGDLLVKYSLVRQICFFAGAIFLFYLSINLLRKKTDINNEYKEKKVTLKSIFLKSVFLTWLNPQALIDGSLLFGTYRTVLANDELFVFSSGIVFSSIVWFFSLTTLVGYLGKKISSQIMRKINLCCAVFLCLFGLNMLLHVAYADEPKIIKVAILDNLMSQKLASEQYVRDYMKGVDVAKIETEKHGYDLKYKTFFYGIEPLSVLKTISSIRKYQPDFIIGPRSSDNFLLLSNYFSDILVISPLASSPDIKNMPNNFYSMNYTDDFSSKIIAEFISKQLKRKGLFAITEINCNSCHNMTNSVVKEYKKIQPHVKIIENQYISDDVESVNMSSVMKGYKDNDVILLLGTSYASGVLISRIVNFEKHPVTFIGGDGWGSWSVSYVGKLHVDFPYEAYRIVPQIIDVNSKNYLEFKEIYKSNVSDTITYSVYNTIMSVIFSLPTEKTNITKKLILDSYREKKINNPLWFMPSSYDVYLINSNHEQFFKKITI